MAFAFEKLKVYQKAIDFADQVAALTQDFPRGFWFLADQLNRVSLAIAANIASASLRGGQRSFHEGRPQELLRYRSGICAGMCAASGTRPSPWRRAAAKMAIPSRWPPPTCATSGGVR